MLSVTRQMAHGATTEFVPTSCTLETIVARTVNAPITIVWAVCAAMGLAPAVVLRATVRTQAKPLVCAEP